MASTLENLADRFSHSVFVNAGLSLSDASTALLVARRVIEDTEDALRDACPDWIPCSERLPSRSEYVWCWVRSGPDERAVEGQWFGDTWEVYRFGVVMAQQVTHWMPKPAGPKEPGT